MTDARNAPHLLRVDAPPEAFAALFAAARAGGLRIGWLDLSSVAPAPLPAPLETAAALGALRAVAVAAGRSVAVKSLHGPPVLRDLLREHFRGCALVLVRGGTLPPLPPDTAALRAAGDAWAVDAPGEAARAFTSTTLAAALRQPRPWGPPLPPRPPRPPAPAPEKKRRKGKDKKDKKDGRDRRL